MFNEKPPMLGGDMRKDLIALRDYLFRMARGLEEVSTAGMPGSNVKVVGYDAAGRQMITGGGGDASSKDVDEIRKNAEELKSIIIKSAENMRALITDGDNTVIRYVDSKSEEYNSLYVARSEYGTFTETINNRIETGARGVVESYNYGSAIESLQADIDLVQAYFTNVSGEIRRGIVLDPTTNQYVTGIAISQNLRFSGECGPSDANNPGDGYTYYYLTSGQTFGLYTSTGWQFWIDGYKRGYFNSEDGMLHVTVIYVEEKIVHGGDWETKTSRSGSRKIFELTCIGG